ncbi:MAG: hypothetical protein ACRD20_10460 [Terriglobales bacterium]
MTDIGGMDCHDWKQLAAAARDEEDPKRLMHLIDQLNHALEERTRSLNLRSNEVAS